MHKMFHINLSLFVNYFLPVRFFYSSLTFSVSFPLYFSYAQLLPFFYYANTRIAKKQKKNIFFCSFYIHFQFGTHLALVVIFSHDFFFSFIFFQLFLSLSPIEQIEFSYADFRDFCKSQTNLTYFKFVQCFLTNAFCTLSPCCCLTVNFFYFFFVVCELCSCCSFLFLSYFILYDSIAVLLLHIGQIP